MGYKTGQIIYHPDSMRFAEVVSVTYYVTEGKIGRCDGFTSQQRVYPVSLMKREVAKALAQAKAKPKAPTLGQYLHAGIMDEANFARGGYSRVKVRWIDEKWATATWDASKFVAAHPLELLAMQSE